MRHWIGAAALGFGLVAASAGTASAQTPSIAGVWEVHGQIVFGNRVASASPTCTFRQTAGRLSGECVGPNARGPLNGLIAGRSVSWTWFNGATTAVGVTGRTNFNGTYVDRHLIQGAMTSSDIPGTGSFTQTR
jgi:hypothetical protein